MREIQCSRLDEQERGQENLGSDEKVDSEARVGFLSVLWTRLIDYITEVFC